MLPTLKRATLVETATGLRSGAVDLHAYLTGVCDRTDAIDPVLCAFVPGEDRRTRLLAEASALEARFPEPANRPLLYGIAAGVKDIFHVHGLPTSAGSLLPPEVLAGPEAAVVTALRAAGALILGKTATTEFAYFEPGPTRNPHNREHTPGGSSSGSAAAVAAGFCPLALGTQTIGSTIRPGAYCGIVGFKPTFGRISTAGVISVSPSLDHVDLFTQYVEDMLLAASLLCDSWEPVHQLAQPVLGVPEGPYLSQASAEALGSFQESLKKLEMAGYTIRRVQALGDIGAVTKRAHQLMSAEMAHVHREWFASYEALYRPRAASFIREGQTVSASNVDAARAGQLMLRLRAGDDYG